jgi:hypothetical protein
MSSSYRITKLILFQNHFQQLLQSFLLFHTHTTMTTIDDQHKVRRSQWFAVAAFSIIALVSMTSNFDDDIQDETKEVKWAVSGVSIALTFSALATIAHYLLKDKFVGKVTEGGLVSISIPTALNFLQDTSVRFDSKRLSLTRLSVCSSCCLTFLFTGLVHSWLLGGGAPRHDGPGQWPRREKPLWRYQEPEPLLLRLVRVLYVFFCPVWLPA